MAKEKTLEEKEVSAEVKLHADARQARINAVNKSIADAKAIRDINEKNGVTETEGAKIDRLAKEAKDLEDASVLNVIEPFAVDIQNIEIMKIYTKLCEVIDYLNGVELKETK